MLGRGQTPRARGRSDGRGSLPVLERIAPLPPIADIAARIEAWSKPGDIVVDLWGRGGWVARAALASQRAAASFESSSLTRLLADLVVRPPDPGHLDAAIAAIALRPHGGLALKPAIEALFASTCPRCSRPVVLEALVWEADESGTPRPVRREYHCSGCKRGSPESGIRRAEPSTADVERAAYAGLPNETRAALRKRFPTPETHLRLPDQLLELHSPRQLEGLHGILEGIELDNRSGPVTAALRLAFLQAVELTSKLSSGRVHGAAIHVAAGQLRSHQGKTWRERNPWSAFEESLADVRRFVAELGGEGMRAQAGRLPADLLELAEGRSNLVLAERTPGMLVRLGEAGELIASTGRASRVRLLIGQAPRIVDRAALGQAYYDTAWALGGGAASMLPFEPLFERHAHTRPDEPDAPARELARSLAVATSMLADSGHVVVLLDDDGPRSLIAGVMGGAAAGYRLVEARLRRMESDSAAALVFVPPTGTVGAGPRTRANRPLPPLEGGAGDARTIPGSGIFGAPEKLLEGRFRAHEAALLVRATVVESLQARGEPACFETLLGEVLVALDRAGHLARLAVRLRPASAESGWRAWLEDEPNSVSAGSSGAAGGSGAAGRSTTSASAADGSVVEELLSLIRNELDRGASRQIRQIEPGLYWLADEHGASPATPLSDRVEWAVFSLLSSSSGMNRAAVFDRIAGMFGSNDAPDGELLRACVESYAAPGATPGSAPDDLTTADRLERRSAEHDAVISVVAELGHRLGARVWIGRRQQIRRVAGRPLAQWLDVTEQAADPSGIAWGPSEELERVDCAWYARHRAAYLFEVEWTAMLGETVLARHGRFPLDDRVVRFLVVPAERAGLVHYKLAHSPVLRAEFAARNWHVIRWDQLASFAARDEVSLTDLEPYLGLDDPGAPEPAAAGPAEAGPADNVPADNGRADDVPADTGPDGAEPRPEPFADGASSAETLP